MKHLLYILITFCCFTTATAAETASSVMKHVVNAMSTKPLQASFTITASGVTQSGTLVMDRDRFVLKTDDLSTWWDGKTQWTYSPALKEVSVTNPGREELAEVNPLLILGSLSSGFASELTSSTMGNYTLSMRPRQGADGIRSAIVSVNGTTWFPREITVDAGGNRFVIKVKSIKTLKNIPAGTFQFNPRQYPGVEINDLR